jgi:phospholipid transport system transporter-binding protein
VSAAPYFSVEADTLGTLRVSGAISYANAARALAQAPQPTQSGAPVTIDLAALENADSATLAVLIAWCARAREHGSVLRFARVPQGLQNLARLCEVDALLGMT